MAITWYSSAGQPSDSVGVVGDLNWDTTNRIVWLKQANNSWAGGAYSNIGPTGPAMLSGVGTPGSSLGQSGNGYTDMASGLTYYKSGSGWTQTGNILGPQGLQGVAGTAGFTLLSNQALTPASLFFINGTTASSTAQTVVINGTTNTQYFVPQQSSAFLGWNCANSGVALTLNLYDVTASTVVYSGSLSANAQANAGIFATTTYPLTAGHVYQFTYTGSGTANCVINPYFLTPSSSTASCIGVMPGFCSPYNTAFTSTSFKALPPGCSATSNVNSRTFQLLRAGALYGVTSTYYPSASGAASASVSWSILDYTGSTTLATGTTTNTSLPQQVSYASAPVAITAAHTIYMTLSGSGTGTFSMDMNIVC